MSNKWTPEKIEDHVKVLTSGMCFYNVVHRASSEIIKQLQGEIASTKADIQKTIKMIDKALFQPIIHFTLACQNKSFWFKGEENPSWASPSFLKFNIRCWIER